jgi:hypothetical protein
LLLPKKVPVGFQEIVEEKREPYKYYALDVLCQVLVFLVPFLKDDYASGKECLDLGLDNTRPHYFVL